MCNDIEIKIITIKIQVKSIAQLMLHIKMVYTVKMLFTGYILKYQIEIE